MFEGDAAGIQLSFQIGSHIVANRPRVLRAQRGLRDNVIVHEYNGVLPLHVRGSTNGPERSDEISPVFAHYILRLQRCGTPLSGEDSMTLAAILLLVR